MQLKRLPTVLIAIAIVASIVVTYYHTVVLKDFDIIAPISTD